MTARDDKRDEGVRAAWSELLEKVAIQAVQPPKQGYERRAIYLCVEDECGAGGEYVEVFDVSMEELNLLRGLLAPSAPSHALPIRECSACGRNQPAEDGVRCEGCGDGHKWSAPVTTPSTTPQKTGETTRDRLVRDLVETKTPVPVATPRTDGAKFKAGDTDADLEVVTAEFSGQLERELAEVSDTLLWLNKQTTPSATARRDEPVWVWGLTQEGIRDEVAQFAALMERKLKANDHKDHWSGAPMGFLLRRLREEIEELELAVKAGKDAGLIGGEAADVGNFAMMIADNMSSLPQLPALPKNRADGGKQTDG